ncbi:MAG: hypothetical protein CM1200mP34_5000 [Verrucomicrobiales bacterium]|nr:MAG: hypothetical protein CM1200mP34_5000 [Verrucomicrobiales bacterium]
MEMMIGFLEQLKPFGIPTCVFFPKPTKSRSDTFPEGFPFYSLFDHYVLSYEEGGMKPDEPIYDAVEQRTGESGAAILYIDDRAENIETGKGRGWQTILQNDEAPRWPPGPRRCLASKKPSALAAAPYAPARSPSCAGSSLNS